MPEIRKFYKNIWKGYDFINIVMTFGLDYFWRKKAASFAKADKAPWLDMCCGTGEMLKHLNRIDEINTIGCDFSAEMMKVAVEKNPATIFAGGNATSLPFRSACFSGLSIGFASRNLQNATGGLETAFKEFYRVLRPCSQLIHLETSQPENLIIKWGYHFFTKLWVAPAGGVLSGDKESYRYLASSMREFHRSEELTEMLKDAGFKKVKVKKLLFGATAIHIATK